MRLFGTNGIREVVGERLTPELATRVAGGIAAAVPTGAPILVGRDGRTSSVALSALVAATLALRGHRVTTLGTLPTPAIQYSVPKLSAQLAVIVTASHNPPEFNGIKCIGADGLEVPRAFEETIERSVEGGTLPSSPFDRIGEIARDDGGAARYLEGILATVDRTRIAARKLRVVLDCGNGASVRTSPELLRRLGCRVVTLNGHLDGRFPGHGSEPTEANLADLMRTVPSVGADLGIAHDGDADRAVFVDARGRYVPGEKILSLMARDRVRRRGGGIVVTPVSGSQAVEEVVRPLGGEVVYTRVGSPSVTREMQRRRAVFGGEENGGLIFPELQLARDGAMTAAAVLDYLAQSDQSIETAIADLPSYTMVKRKVACPPGQGEAVIAEVARGLGSWSERQESLDGLKVYPKGGWVLLRPSGTEPLIRVFAESKDPAVAGALADEGTRRVEAALRALPARPG